MFNFKNSILLFLICTFLSCGKSPFLNEESSNSKGNGSQTAFQSNFSLTNATRSTRDSRGQSIFSQKYLVKGFWQVGPSVGNENKLTIMLIDQGGEYVDLPLEWDIYLWMPGMGHGSFPITVTKLSTGIYQLTEVFFTMDGYWDLHLGLRDEESLVDEVRWPIDL